MCLALGIDDPKHWFANVPEDVFDLWYAYYQVEPWGNEWEQTADTLAMQTNIIATIARSVGGKIEPKDSIEFMPFDSRRYERDRVKPRGITDPKQQEMCLAINFGFTP